MAKDTTITPTPAPTTVNDAAASGANVPTITPTSLAGNTPPMVVPPAPTGSGTAGLEGAVTAVTDKFTQDLETNLDTSKKDEGQSFDKYIKSYLGTKGSAELTDERYQKEVDPLKKDLDEINQQILEERHGLQRTIQALEKNPEGLFGDALANRKEELTRSSLYKQADLSIIQLARQGRYDSAKAVIDRAVAVQVEKDKMKNEGLRVAYERNKDMFDKDEQRLFETKQGDRERELNKKEQDLKDARDLAIEALRNGAPSSVAFQAMQSGTFDDALRLVGGYVGAMDRERLALARAAANKDDSIELGPEDKRKLLGSGLTKDMIDGVQADINEVGLDNVLSDTGLTAGQKDAIRSVYGTAAAPDLTRTGIATLLGYDDAAQRPGFFGGKSDATKKLDTYDRTVEAYRKAGLSDADIFDKLQKSLIGTE